MVASSAAPWHEVAAVHQRTSPVAAAVLFVAAGVEIREQGHGRAPQCEVATGGGSGADLGVR